MIEFLVELGLFILRPLIWLFAILFAWLTSLSVYRVINAYHHTVRLIRHSQPVNVVPERSIGRLLIVGDSTAVGIGASRPELSIAGRLATAFPRVQIVNDSHNGASSEKLLHQLDLHRGERYDAVLIHVSGIDILDFKNLRGLAKTVEDMILSAKTIGRSVIIVNTANIGSSPLFTWALAPLRLIYRRRSFMARDAIKAVCVSQGATFVNMCEENAADPLVSQPKRYFATDGIHPNDEGYELAYARLSPVITPLFT